VAIRAAKEEATHCLLLALNRLFPMLRNAKVRNASPGLAGELNAEITLYCCRGMLKNERPVYRSFLIFLFLFASRQKENKTVRRGLQQPCILTKKNKLFILDFLFLFASRQKENKTVRRGLQQPSILSKKNKLFILDFFVSFASRQKENKDLK